jgi:PilZ domain-containing protein
MANEKRIAPRRRILKAGSINFDGAAVGCTIRNLSATGAALDVETPLSIPDCFKLAVEGESLDQPCHVVWRKERRIGVAFD